MASSSAPPPPPPPSGWADLPRDVLWSVLIKVGQREIFSSAGFVCAAWWHFTRDEPVLWRRIDLTVPEDDTVEEEVDDDDGESSEYECYYNLLVDDPPICQVKIPVKDGADSSAGWKAMAASAIDRSAGQCEAFWGRADDEVLLYLADRAASMKSLHLTLHYEDVSAKVFIVLIKKFPLLEELELVLKSVANNYTTNSEHPSTNSWVQLFQATCEACSHLHHFTVRNAGKAWCSNSYYGIQQRLSSIPMMHSLRSLELSGDSFTVNVVMQIVDKCPGLEILDISNMPYLWRMDEKKLRNKCSKLKDLRLPATIYKDSDIRALFTESTRRQREDWDFYSMMLCRKQGVDFAACQLDKHWAGGPPETANIKTNMGLVCLPKLPLH